VKNIRVSATLTPAVAIASASATLWCCLPWGIGAALGAALGLSVFFGRFQVWFLILSVALLLLGLFQVLRRRSCQRRSRTEVALLSIAAAVVVAIVLFPQWVAGLLVGHLP
jgi:predicted branched-subunit amino acid permease